MKYVGEAYTINLSGEAQLLQLRSGLSNGVLVQPQSADLCYRLDGKQDNVSGFVLPELQKEHIQVNTAGLVIWAARNKGRLVVQEYAD